MTPREILIAAFNKGWRLDHSGNPVGFKCNRLNSGGYRCAVVRFGTRKQFHLALHRLQAYIKFGEALFVNGIEVRHLNGNKLDNSCENIAIGTHQQNMLDIDPVIRKRSSVAAMASPRWRENRVKLTPEQIAEASELYAMHPKGLPRGYLKAMLERFGVAKSTLHYAMTGQTHRQIK